MKRTVDQIIADADRIGRASARAVVRVREANANLRVWLAMEERGEGAVRFVDGLPEFRRGARIEYPRGEP